MKNTSNAHKPEKKNQKRAGTGIPRILLLLLAVAALAVNLAACAQTPEPPGPLVLYTSMKDSLIAALAEDFQDKHPHIALETRIDGAGSLMARIEAERGEGQILADLLWTSEIPDFYWMKDEGLLLPYSPAGADQAFNPLENTGGCFFPARLGTMGIAYNTDRIQTPPASWHDLAGPDYTDGFAIANPETSGTALMAVILLTEAFGEPFFHDLRANGGITGGGSTQVVDAVAAGDLAACLAVDYITFDKAKAGAPIALAYPPEMIVIPSPAAIFKDSPNTAAAKQFADYLLTPDAQQIIANTGTLPVLDGISVPAEYNIPPSAGAMARAIEVNDADILNGKDAIVGAFLDIMRG
ncbi:MAG: ABC transporter substrate-binding protein [Oscillospiraceae bacterium]|nr:ABC transporter substrate-binding protein [Oscillospiraceae bacterium]